MFRKLKSGVRLARHALAVWPHFDSNWYRNANPDVKAAGIIPLFHFLRHGWREGRDPTPGFDMRGYLQDNPDVNAAGINPYFHYLKYGMKEGRRLGSTTPVFVDRIVDRNASAHARAFHMTQDQTFPLAAERAKKLFVIVVPEHNEMSGGIYSFFSIARALYGLRFKHDYYVLLMTRPNKYDVTYTRQRNFRNSEDVFRLEQIQRCYGAEEIYLQIPEYAAPSFVESLHPDLLFYLKSRQRFFINILNQKTEVMPEKEEFEDLRAICHGLTQSVAHHAYFGQSFADRYNLPTMLLPAFTDLSNYDSISFAEKEKLILYSPDDAPWRAAALAALQEGLPDYRLQEIRGITFDEYMDIATRCRFSLTFGEGFDGYLAQPIYQGGVGFAVYNDEYFPFREMREFKNLFSSSQDLIDNIVMTIRTLESQPELYNSVNKSMMGIYEQLYSKSDYLNRILQLKDRRFDYYPMPLSSEYGGIKL
ncbi:hypothetical protein [Bradyrhizobium sp. WSM1253]|uniref:hypothetical protein n=1 Tax=Bradyrhizobium sp. WSM1253 TaxID=319003 RepID=UPI00025D2E11|nr:hypothetical protein [Bradyrhizobium sp. WSM1253]EIG63511.1 hypothetical protein Bra1253DRAFT_08490 [Bradyrhizobium sp. WSM1253]